jgi:uncharacterized RDD family membrane protein YckC
MSHLIVETSEGVALRQSIAGAGSRFAAGLLDGVILLFGLLSLLSALAVASMVDPGGVSAFLRGLVVAGFILLVILYHVGFHALAKGQTPGKKVCAIRVVSSDGQPATAVSIVVRALLWPIDVLMMVPMPLGLLLCALTPRHQRLGDLVAGTMVVRVDAPRAEKEPFPYDTWTKLAPRVLPLTPGAAARLSHEDRAFLRALWMRNSLSEDAKRRLFVDAARHYARVLDLGDFDDARVVLKELYLFAREHAREA